MRPPSWSPPGMHSSPVSADQRLASTPTHNQAQLQGRSAAVLPRALLQRCKTCGFEEQVQPGPRPHCRICGSQLGSYAPRAWSAVKLIGPMLFALAACVGLLWFLTEFDGFELDARGSGQLMLAAMGLSPLSLFIFVCGSAAGTTTTTTTTTTTITTTAMAIDEQETAPYWQR